MTYDFSQFRLSGLAPDATMKQLLGDTRPVHLQNVVGTTMFAEVSLSGLGGRAGVHRFGYKGMRAARLCFERLKPVVV